MDRGWYTPSGNHIPINQSYFVGDIRGSLCGFCEDDYRDFFVFDLAGVTQSIESATLALYVPGAASDRGPGYGSQDVSENYELHDVVTPIATLLAGTGGVAAHTDLGTGVVYGSRTMTAADNATVIEIPLNSSAIAAMNLTHGQFAIGGSITTLDNVANNEYTFGGTSNLEMTQLRLTLVPEPANLFLLATGAIVLSTRRELRPTEATCGQS